MSNEQIGNIDLVKQLNAAAVYRLIDKQSPISRIQIAEICGLAPASVTKISRQLLERGLIKEIAQQASTGGRRAVSLTIEGKPFHSVAVRLGRKSIDIGLFDLRGKALATHHAEFFYADVDALTQGLVKHIADFIKAQQKQIKQLIAIAVSLPGLVNADTGMVNYMPNISVKQLGLSELITDKFKVPCFIGNDISSLALAESYFGASKNYHDSILISIHYGVGAGIIANKEVFLGRSSNVGEIGHIQIDPLGKKCQCGNFGCLEIFAANPEIVARAKALLAQGYPSQLQKQADFRLTDICKAANAGDELSKLVLTEAGNSLGKALAITVNLFNPELIVISGDITQAENILFSAIRKCIEKQSLSAFSNKLDIVKSSLMEEPTLRAFSLIKRAMLDGTLLQKLL